MASQAHSNKSRAWPLAFGALAIIGFIDATILTIEHYANLNLPCYVTGGCERVLTSKYSEIAGIPISLAGTLFYGVVLFLAMFALVNKTQLPRKILLLWGSVGFVTSLGLTAIQAFIIKAWCLYCLFSALTSTLIFILAIVYFVRTKESVTDDTEEDQQDE